MRAEEFLIVVVSGRRGLQLSAGLQLERTYVTHEVEIDATRDEPDDA